jgi:hypothetical protein
MTLISRSLKVTHTSLLLLSKWRFLISSISGIGIACITLTTRRVCFIAWSKRGLCTLFKSLKCKPCTSCLQKRKTFLMLVFLIYKSTDLIQNILIIMKITQVKIEKKENAIAPCTLLTP